MKKSIYTLTALLALAASVPSYTLQSTTVADKKGTTTSDPNSGNDGSTNSNTLCPRNDENGCGIYKRY